MPQQKKFKARKSLGQNFLTNPKVAKKIIEVSQLKGNELVVEIGPGFGALTEFLLQAAKKIIAIEKDEFLFDSLKEKFKNCEKLHLINKDILDFSPPYEDYVLIANIPYSITSPILDHFIRGNKGLLPKKMILLVQKEVAEKICAAPPKMNVLALHVQAFGDPKILSSVSKNNFNPRPKVDSAIIRIDFPEKPKFKINKYFFENIHKAFAHKRKMLRHVFPSDFLLKKGIDPTRRPETLTLKEWTDLSQVP